MPFGDPCHFNRSSCRLEAAEDRRARGAPYNRTVERERRMPRRLQRLLPSNADRVGNISENPNPADGSEWRLVNGCRAAGSDLSADGAQPGDRIRRPGRSHGAMTGLDDPGVVALYGTHWRRLTTIPASASTRMCLSNKAPWFTVADDLPNI